MGAGSLSKGHGELNRVPELAVAVFKLERVSDDLNVVRIRVG